MPEVSWRLPSDGAPVTCETSTLTCGSAGFTAAGVGVVVDVGTLPSGGGAAAGSGGNSYGIVMPAATWPGARGMKLGGLPISVAILGAACCAIRDTRRSACSA